MREWLWKLGAMLRWRRMESERREELQFHYDEEVATGLRQGLGQQEARRRARLKAGLVAEGLEATTGAMRIGWADALSLELRHALRALTRNAAYGSLAVAVLGASVAITTLIFLMLQGVVLRPLPYADPERLVRVFDSSADAPEFPVALGHYLEYRARARTLAGIALYTGQDVELTGSGQSRLLTGLAITPEFFAVLGRQPALGRAFEEADTRAGIRHAIISDTLWREQFAADPAIVGRTVRLDREAWTIVGVAPAGFQHVGGDYRSPLQGDTVDIWVPLVLERPEQAIRYWHFCNAVARLRDGVTAAQAREELSRLSTAFDLQFSANSWKAGVEPLLDEVTGRSRQIIWLLMAAGGLVVLVACANIAGLAVARAAARRQELALRRALGASRWQLVRVGLAENLVLGIAAAGLGIALTILGLPLLRQLLPTDFPRAHEIAFSWQAALVATATALVTAMVAGLVASSNAIRLRAAQRTTDGPQSTRLRTALVVGEVALAGTLCAGALFLARSFHEVATRPHGFDPSHVLTFQLAPPAGIAPQPGQLPRLYHELRQAIATVPGVEHVGLTTNLPWSGYDENTGFQVVGRPEPGDDEPNTRFQAATAGYFEATGMRLVAGRLFDAARDANGQPPVVIVNEALVRRYLDAGSAIGTSLDVFGEKREVVGVVGDVRDFPADAETKPALWFPLTQVGFPNVFAAVRADDVEPASLTSAVAAAVRQVDADLPLADIRTLERRTSVAMAPRRFALWLFQAFALLALLLACAGIYGLLTYIVRQRRKELGIRAALGASPGHLWRMVLRDGMRMAGAGAVLCLLLVPVGGRLLQSFLFNVSTFDPLTIAGAATALLATTIAASLGPAWAALRSNPSSALRED
jgi:macrolide transport system ATP-binding/permease protein